jgi:hypothetical protein
VSWKDACEWWIGKDVEGGDHHIFDDIQDSDKGTKKNLGYQASEAKNQTWNLTNTM